MKIEPRPFVSSNDLIDAAVDLLNDLFTQSKDRTPYCIILPGGTTPLSVYARIAGKPPRISPALHLLISDERHVPVDAPESNLAGMLPMIRAIQLSPRQLLAVQTDLDLEEAARTFDQRIRDFVASGGKFPVGFLGLGEDGHTASLFSIEDVLRSRGKYALAVRRPSPPHRISISEEVLALCDQIIFLVTGRSKQQIRQKLLQDPSSVPAGIAVQRCPKVDIWFSEE